MPGRAGRGRRWARHARPRAAALRGRRPGPRPRTARCRRLRRSARRGPGGPCSPSRPRRSWSQWLLRGAASLADRRTSGPRGRRPLGVASSPSEGAEVASCRLTTGGTSPHGDRDPDLPALGRGSSTTPGCSTRATNKMLPLGQVGTGGLPRPSMPPTLLDSYGAVDVSLEDDDGDPAHSVTSVLRAHATPTQPPPEGQDRPTNPGRNTHEEDPRQRSTAAAVGATASCGCTRPAASRPGGRRQGNTSLAEVLGADGEFDQKWRDFDISTEAAVAVLDAKPAEPSRRAGRRQDPADRLHPHRPAFRKLREGPGRQEARHREGGLQGRRPCRRRHRRDGPALPRRAGRDGHHGAGRSRPTAPS